MRLGWAALLCLLALPAHAGWSFTPAQPVSGQTGKGVFTHLESAGRKSIAVAGDSVAVVWEDNRTGGPQTYIAFRRGDKGGFSAPAQLSTGKEAYEPAVAAVPGGFAAAWEQDGYVWIRFAAPGRLGPAERAGRAESSQATLASEGSRIFAAWACREGRRLRIVVAPLTLDGDRLQAKRARPVDPVPPTQDQLYPSLALTADGVAVAWEDRREGHTRLYTSISRDGLNFAPLRALNAVHGSRDPSMRFGRGTGVTRVALASDGKQRVAAVWMDKREFMGGYDIYAAVSDDGGRTYGPNEKAQDMFGDNQPQWHPAIAVSAAGQVVAVWDDPRDGTPDLWLSWRKGSEWSDDLSVKPASGPGSQASPAMAFDAKGRLHLVWVGPARGGGERVWYSRGRFRAEPR